MSDQERVFVNGEWHNGRRLSYNPIAGEPWTEYMTEDGTTIRVRIVVAGVFLIENPDPSKLPDYVVSTSKAIIDVEPSSDNAPPQVDPGFGSITGGIQ